jgi:hypothetical protein
MRFGSGNDAPNGSSSAVANSGLPGVGVFRVRGRRHRASRRAIAARASCGGCRRRHAQARHRRFHRLRSTPSLWPSMRQLRRFRRVSRLPRPQQARWQRLQRLPHTAALTAVTAGTVRARRQRSRRHRQPRRRQSAARRLQRQHWSRDAAAVGTAGGNRAHDSRADGQRHASSTAVIAKNAGNCGAHGPPFALLRTQPRAGGTTGALTPGSSPPSPRPSALKRGNGVVFNLDSPCCRCSRAQQCGLPSWVVRCVCLGCGGCRGHQRDRSAGREHSSWPCRCRGADQVARQLSPEWQLRYLRRRAASGPYRLRSARRFDSPALVPRSAPQRRR